MSKGEATRRHIVVQTADLLNTRGYRTASISEIMETVGLQKGGIYRHFESRDELVAEAFEYAISRLRNRFAEAIQGKSTATEKLLALFDVIRNAAYEPALKGGCPAMNLAIESDDADSGLRGKARSAMTRLITLFQQVIAQGVENGEFGEADARASAIHIVASIEGAIMLANLYKNRSYSDAVLSHLESLVRAKFG
jgi:TetR/AcrR family transcriptional repressor of nem operon